MKEKDEILLQTI